MSETISYSADISTGLVVIGAGPGGYSAAFRAADLGTKVVLIDTRDVLGGVCLNEGCIPSKALLHACDRLRKARELEKLGLTLTGQLDLDVLRKQVTQTVHTLTSGLTTLQQKRNITFLQGQAKFSSQHSLAIQHKDGSASSVAFENCIVAAGSRPRTLPFVPQHPNIWTAKEALQLPVIPEKLLIVGGGIIGLEMATVYQTLGSKVTVIETENQLMPGMDRDLSARLKKTLSATVEIRLSTMVDAIEAQDNGFSVQISKGGEQQELTSSHILVAVGRKPNTDQLDVKQAGLNVETNGSIPTDDQGRSAIDHIYAIGDCSAGPMLAHKASYEGKIAAESVAGLPALKIANTIPAVAYTYPEVACCGYTENQLKAENIAYKKAIFPWAASGRAQTANAENGTTKILYAPESKLILGVGIVGEHASELIASATLAIGLEADLEDITQIIFAHPTLSETLLNAAEVGHGSVVELLP